MMKRLCLLSLGSLALTLMLPMGAALADAIDGHWCHAEAGRLEISGPYIVTPGGTQMQGIYGRHSFSYTVPQTETPAGATTASATETRGSWDGIKNAVSQCCGQEPSFVGIVGPPAPHLLLPQFLYRGDGHCCPASLLQNIPFGTAVTFHREGCYSCVWSF